jgi:hypothetical protein
MPLMSRIYLSNNNFTGTLPHMPASTALRVLELDHNGFGGPLPDLSFMDSAGRGISINLEARSGRRTRSASPCSALVCRRAALSRRAAPAPRV